MGKNRAIKAYKKMLRRHMHEQYKSFMDSMHKFTLLERFKICLDIIFIRKKKEKSICNSCKEICKATHIRTSCPLYKGGV